jgi:hypothetical protein
MDITTQTAQILDVLLEKEKETTRRVGERE